MAGLHCTSSLLLPNVLPALPALPAPLPKQVKAYLADPSAFASAAPAAAAGSAPAAAAAAPEPEEEEEEDMGFSLFD